MNSAANEPVLLRCEQSGVLCECIVKNEFVRGVTSSENYHFHSAYELHVPVTGTLHLMVEDRDLTLSPGEVCILPPDCSHYVFADDAAFRIGFRFTFARAGRENSAAYALFARTYGTLQDAHILRGCDVYAKYLRAAAENFSLPLPRFMTTDLLFLSLYEIADALAQSSAPSLPPDKNASDAALAEQIEIFVNQNYARPVHLEELATALHLGVRQTQRVTARLFGMTFSTLLGKRRLSAARLLLRTTALPIEEVALRCGFEDKNYFYRKFSAAFSLTPGQYRAQRR